MKHKLCNRSLAILLIFIIALNIYPSIITFAAKDSTTQKLANWPKGPSVVAESAIVMEANTGLVLYSKDINTKRYPASITKILTTLIALENCSLSEVVTFSRDAVYSVEPGSSGIGVYPGEQLTIEQSLYAIMLASANEVSAGVGEYIAGSVEGFGKLMTEKAKELGCKNSNFVNAHGLFNENHYTTAYDMALITQAAMKNKTFRQITSTKKYVIPPTNKYLETRYLTNHHQMVYGNKYPQYAYDTCIGGKTGYIEKARNTLVTMAKKEDMELICVVLRSQAPNQSRNQYTDTISLLDFCFDNFKVCNLNNETNAPLIEENLLFTRFNRLFNEDDSPISISGSLSAVVPIAAKENDIIQNIDYYDSERIFNGKRTIGEITYRYGDTVVGGAHILYTKKETPTLTTSNAVIQKNSEDNTIANLFQNVSDGNLDLKPYIVLGIVCLIILLLLFTLFLLRKKNNNNKGFDLRKRSRTYESVKDSFMDFTK